MCNSGFLVPAAASDHTQHKESAGRRVRGSLRRAVDGASSCLQFNCSVVDCKWGIYRRILLLFFLFFFFSGLFFLSSGCLMAGTRLLFTGTTDRVTRKLVLTFIFCEQEGEGGDDRSRGGRGIYPDCADATGNRRGNAAPCFRCDNPSSGPGLHLEYIELPENCETVHLASVGRSCDDRWCDRPSSGMVGVLVHIVVFSTHSEPPPHSAKCLYWANVRWRRQILLWIENGTSNSTA